MNYTSILIVCLSTIIYAILDLIWIGYFMKNYYINWLVHIIRPISQWNLSHVFAAVVTWGLIVFGIFIFVQPLVKVESLAKTFLYGAFFGTVLYGLYETTNYAVIYSWSTVMVFVDIAWGSFACGVITVFMKLLLQV